MPKIVNSWNEWDPLKRVIVERPEGTDVPAPELAWWYDFPKGGYPLGSYGPFPQEMVDAANEQMDKLGFEVIPIPYEKVISFGGALPCTTLDIYREGKLEDYFANQIGRLLNG